MAFSKTENFHYSPENLRLAESLFSPENLRLALASPNFSIDDSNYSQLLRLSLLPEFSNEILTRFDFRGVPLKDHFSLFPHQIETLKWMRMRERTEQKGILGGIVCLKMGMGKTLTALTHILSSPKGDFPTLVIASKTVMTEWIDQGLNKFFEDKSVEILLFHKEYTNLDSITREDILKFDIVLTTYDMLTSINRKTNFYNSICEMGDNHSWMKDKIVAIHCQNAVVADRPLLKGCEVLYGTPWHRIVCDESQRFANPKTILYKCILALYGKYKWCLSGTPIRNYDTDIWSQLRFCGYKSISSAIEWNRKGHNAFSQEHLERVLYQLDYSDTMIKLPEKHEHDFVVVLEGNQKAIYESILTRTKQIFANMMCGTADFAAVLAMFVRLRQSAVAPYLLVDSSKDHQPSHDNPFCFSKESDAGFKAVKILKILEILETIPKDEKVVFFTSFTSYLDLMQEAIALKLPSLSIFRIDGSTKASERLSMIQKFKDQQNSSILLMTYKVGGEGLNLVEANHCICGEPWWTDAVHNQAKARIWRTGQTKDVHVYNIIVSNSIEERILEICKQKEDMAKMYLSKKDDDEDEKKKKKVVIDKFTMGKVLGYFF